MPQPSHSFATFDHYIQFVGNDERTGQLMERFYLPTEESWEALEQHLRRGRDVDVARLDEILNDRKTRVPIELVMFPHDAMALFKNLFRDKRK